MAFVEQMNTRLFSHVEGFPVVQGSIWVKRDGLAPLVETLDTAVEPSIIRTCVPAIFFKELYGKNATSAQAH